MADTPTIRHSPTVFPRWVPFSLSHKLAVAIYKEKLRPRDRVMSSRSKYVQLSVCRRRSARLIITGPPPTLPFNGYVPRIYPPTLTNERVRPLSRRRAQTINIDSIISRIVLTKNYFPVAATDPEGEGRMKSDLSACTPSPFHPPPPAQSPSHCSFPSPVYLVLIFAFFFIAHLFDGAT